MKTSQPASGFTLTELLVVIAVIAILASLLLPVLSQAKTSARRAVCINNLRQCGIALSLYAEAYKRYPHQREPTGGIPYLAEQTVWTPLGYYIEREWDEVVRLGIYSGYDGSFADTPDLRLSVFSCPAKSATIRNHDFIGPHPPEDKYVFRMNYYYVGGALRWSEAYPAYSPIKSTDPARWALMVDMIRSWHTTNWLELAHKERNGQPAGANHLFNDQHVEWIEWNGGHKMRANTYWETHSHYYWRRTMGFP